jgi:glycolate dehydrogenase FAD-binding subunit
VERPATGEQAATLLREAARRGDGVRFEGGGSKGGWGNRVSADTVISTAGLTRILEYDPGDLTAVVEAGIPLAEAQAAFAGEGQRLALDPPDDGATIGGVLATGDSGPLRHRFGAARDLVLGATLALPDGSLAKSGGKVIKNVAGYDLAKLMCGAHGTLGLIVQVALRLHPLAASRATTVERFGDSRALEARAQELSAQPLELESLDVAWEGGEGELLTRFAGTAARERALALGGELVEDDERVWARQREHQRGRGVVVRVSALPSELQRVLRVADRAGARVVGRAALGLSWLSLPDAEAAAVDELRAELAPRACVVIEGPPGIDRWGPEPPASGLMRRVKERFDPGGTCNPGVFVAGV